MNTKLLTLLIAGVAVAQMASAQPTPTQPAPTTSADKTTPSPVEPISPNVSPIAPNVSPISPNVSPISPNVSTPAPNVSTPAPDLNTPTPNAGTPAPNAVVPAPGVDTPVTGASTSATGGSAPVIGAGTTVRAVAPGGVPVPGAAPEALADAPPEGAPAGVPGAVNEPGQIPQPVSVSKSSDATLDKNAEVPSALHATAIAGDGLLLNFRNAPLEKVLDYMSDAAGFTIVLDTPVRGRVDVWSAKPLGRDEAVDLLDSVLRKNGYAAVRNGRTLTIVKSDDVKTKAVPVILESDPNKIPKNDQVATYILPVRFVEVGQLLKDLQPLVSMQTTMTANESGNSIVITDTQANIHRVAEIIKAIDGGAESVSEVRVFHLQFADPMDMASLLTSLFPDDTTGKSGSGGNTQSPMEFGPSRFLSRMMGGGGPPGSGNSGGGGGGNSRVRKREKVLAVADQRTASLIVTAPKDSMEHIANMIAELDSDRSHNKRVHVISLQNAEAPEVLTVLQDMFMRNNQVNSRNGNQNSVLTTRSQQQQSSGNSSSSRGSSSFGGNSRGGSSFP